MNPVYENIITRRSTRRFKDQMVEAEKLEEILEAGRHAPSGGNNQSTHFLAIRSPEVLDKLCDLVREAFARMEVTPGMYRSMARSIQIAKAGPYRFHYDAPVLILTANQKEYGNNMADCACALENMMLEANELDLGTCWINQLKWLNEEPEIVAYLQSLGMKETERVYGALAVGYPDTSDGMPSRTPLPRTGNQVTYID